MSIKQRANPYFRVVDIVDLAAGETGNNWKLHTYIPGTTDDKAAYQDKDGSTPHSNPIILTNGQATIWWDGVYDLKLTDDNDVQKWTFSNFGSGEDVQNFGNYNLVNDGGFEDDANGDNHPDQWTVTEYADAGNGAGVVTVDATDQIEGAQSLKFTSQGDGGGYALSALFQVREGAILFADWMMKSSTAGVRNVVEVVWYNKSQVQISTSSLYDDSATNPTSWTEKTGNATAPSTARFAAIRIYGCHSSDSTPGSTWYDDVIAFTSDAGAYVKKTGDTMSGDLQVDSDVIINDNSATLRLIQANASADNGDHWSVIVRDLPRVLSVEVQTVP